MCITLDASISNWYVARLSHLSWMDVLCVDLGLPTSFNWKFGTLDGSAVILESVLRRKDELRYTASVQGFPMFVRMPQPGK